MIFRHLLNMRSHPTWVRGLKQYNRIPIANVNWSYPTWVRGLKPWQCAGHYTDKQSHHTWVRGLKHFTFNCTFMELKFSKGFGM